MARTRQYELVIAPLSDGGDNVQQGCEKLNSEMDRVFTFLGEDETHKNSTANPHNTTAAQVGAYTTAETDTAISTAIANLVDTAPSMLNTLNELAAALGDDPNFATTVTTSLGEKASIAQLQDYSFTPKVTDIITKGPIVDVRAFGADISGVADSTTAFNDAVDYAGENGTVYIPKGIYKLSETIMLKTGMTVQGDGKNVSVIRMYSNYPIFATQEVEDTVYSNILIKGLRFENINVFAYHIDIYSPMHVGVKDCYFTSPVGTTDQVAGIRFRKGSGTGVSNFLAYVDNCIVSAGSIEIGQGVTDSWIRNCAVWGYCRSFAIHLAAGSQMVSDCQIVGSPVHGGIWVEDNLNEWNIDGVQIDNCYFDGSYDDIDSGVGINAVKVIASSITNCWFWRQMDEGIKLDTGHNVVIANNKFQNCNRRDAGKSDIVFIGATSYCNVNNNTFHRNVTHTNKGYAIFTNNTCMANVYSGNVVYFTTYYLDGQWNILDLETSQCFLNIPNPTALQKKYTPYTWKKYTLTFFCDGVTPSISGVTTLAKLAGTSKNHSFPTAYPGKIVGISMCGIQTRSAGSVTITPTINGSKITDTSAESVWDMTTSAEKNVYIMSKRFTTPFDFSAMSKLGLHVTTSSDFAPNPMDIAVTLYIEEREKY
jgi:hypothetical protein